MFPLSAGMSWTSGFEGCREPVLRETGLARLRGSDVSCPRRRRRRSGTSAHTAVPALASRSPRLGRRPRSRPEPPPRRGRSGTGSLVMESQVPERRTRKSNGRHGAEAKSLDQRKLLRALQAVRDGDFSARLPRDQTGLAGKVADTFNEIVASNQRLARELERAGQIVGKDGKTRHRVASDRRSGAWGAMEGA